MRREVIEFKDFQTLYINHAKYGYYPVYLAERTETEGEGKDRTSYHYVDLDMVYPPRLADGKVKFLAVSFEHNHELKAILEYCRECIGYHKEAIEEQIKRIWP